MKQVKIITLKIKNGFFQSEYEGIEEIVEDMYQKGFSYRGYIPFKLVSYGSLNSIKLIFEKEY